MAKVTVAHSEILRNAIQPLDTEEMRTRYRSGQYPRSNARKDVNKRYRWDLLWASGVYGSVMEDGVGYNDSHIDTALRSIVSPL